jgi:hypothetical protein
MECTEERNQAVRSEAGLGLFIFGLATSQNKRGELVYELDLPSNIHMLDYNCYIVAPLPFLLHGNDRQRVVSIYLYVSWLLILDYGNNHILHFVSQREFDTLQE